MDLSQHKSKLRTLKLHARLIYGDIAQQSFYASPLGSIISVIDPSLPLDLIIVYDNCYFDPGCCEQSVDMGKGRLYLKDSARTRLQQCRFKILSEAHRAGGFRLVLCAVVPRYMVVYAMEVLEYDVKEYGYLFGSLLPELLVTFSMPCL